MNAINAKDKVEKVDDRLNGKGGVDVMREKGVYKTLRSGKVVATAVEPGVGVTEAARARALLKEQQLNNAADFRVSNASTHAAAATNTNSSKRSCPSTVTNLNITSRKHQRNSNDNYKTVDPYLLRLLQVDEVAADRAQGIAWGTTKTATVGTLGTNRSGSTEFRVPEPPKKKSKTDEKGARDLRDARERPPLPPAKPPWNPLSTASPAPALDAKADADPVDLAKVANPQVQLTVPHPSSIPMAVDIQASNSLEKTKTTNPSTQPDTDKAAKVSASQPQWDYMDTKSVLGEDVFDTLKTSVVQHQKEYLEQLFDLHRAIAVQRLLVRHSEDQKTLVKEYQKEEGRAKKALQRAGLCFGTTTEWHKGLHPDSQFAALSSDAGTDVDGSGDDVTGSDVAASGSGGNGKSGNGSGGGSTSQFVPNIAGQASIPGLPGNMAVQRAAPSGASNSPMIGVSGPWGPAFGVNMPNVSGISVNGVAPGLIDVPGAMMFAPQPNMQYGADPMMWWYQDYCNRLAQQQSYGRTAQGQKARSTATAGNAGSAGAGNSAPASNAPGTGTGNVAKTTPPAPVPPPARGGYFPGPFKWWHDPKMAFGAPLNPKDVFTRAKEISACREGTEVESAPPSEEITDTEDDKKNNKGDLPSESRPLAKRKRNPRRQEFAPSKAKADLRTENIKNIENIEKDDADNPAEDNERAQVVKHATRKRRIRKRLLKDPVAAASSGTSGPLPHHSSEGVAHPLHSRRDNSHEAIGNVAKLLMSISTHEAGTAGGSGSRGTRPQRRKSSRKSSGS